MIRVPFFLLFGFNKGTQEEKGKRVLRNLRKGQGDAAEVFLNYTTGCVIDKV